MSQPYSVALMIDAAGIEPGDTVLEIGAGSGYAAAILGQIAEKVIAIERHEELAQLARDRMERLGYGNVKIITGDGTNGCPETAPFDAILVSAGGPALPVPLRSPLKLGGGLVIPIGSAAGKRLVRVTRDRSEEHPYALPS